MTRFFSGLRWTLDKLYLAGGVIAAFFLLAILVLILIQMAARWTGEAFPGAPDYAGYSMAGASFFAFAYALNHGAHIRVALLINALGTRRWWGEVWCFLIGSLITTYFAWYACKAVYWSNKLNDISQGQDATPLWIPQMFMAAGSILFALCFWDNLVRLFFTGSHGIVTEKVEEHPTELAE